MQILSRRDVCDGTFFQSHELFAYDDTALKILLYYGDVNLCNPLTNKIHKITLLYYQLANIQVEYRSKLNSIHLLNMWMLAQVLPIILNGKFVTTDSHHWECFSSLLEIMGIAYSTRISLETIVYLKSAIKNHLVLFKNAFPGAPLYPNNTFSCTFQVRF